jgi:pimeloyl-ACP methyl ester carboxylesterase
MFTITTRYAAALVVAIGLGLGAVPAAAETATEPPNGGDASATSKTTRASVWPRGKVFIPKKIFTRVKDDELDQVVLAANPRLYLYPDLDLAADKILVIGMPGWGGRSENFIWTLVNGLKEPGLTRRLVVAAIQDLENGGPGYQGQGDRDHANRWDLGGDTVVAMRRFISRLSDELGHLDVYLAGYSTGSFSGPLLAAAMARWRPKEDYRVKGAVCIGTGSPISASRLVDKQQRVMFIVVPEYRGEEKDGKPLRDDQNNRLRAERYFAKLKQDGAQAYLRHIETARRHVDWHWGLLSQCRYFRTSRIDPGRGYWPNYWMANPETYSYVRPFIQGQAPPEKAPSHPPQECPY